MATRDAGSWGLWRTPLGTDYKGGHGNLPHQVLQRTWQTPVADDSVDRTKGKMNSRGEPKLSAQVKLWPTPHGFSKDGKSNGPSGNELGSAVNKAEKMWPVRQP